MLGRATFLLVLDPALIPGLLLWGEELLHWSLHFLLVVKVWLQEVSQVIIWENLVQTIRLVWNQFDSFKFWEFVPDSSRSIRFCIVLLQKRSLFANQCHLFLLHNGIHSLQLFGVKVGINGLTDWNKLVVYPFIIPPDTEHHLVFETLMLCKILQNFWLTLVVKESGISSLWKISDFREMSNFRVTSWNL